MTRRQEAANKKWHAAYLAYRNAAHGERQRARDALYEAVVEVLMADTEARRKNQRRGAAA